MSDRGASLRYLPGLDGLRAVAVGAVMVYHGGLGVFPGGFLGVDVFFALSGFLITSLLLAEWGQHGRIALGAFWARRARRLLPAIVVLILGVVLWAWLINDLQQLDRVRRDGLATLFYASNWSFVVQGSSYFDQFQAPSPFRHTWSLAIEEQFYLVFPFVFIVLMRVLRRRRWVALAFGIGALASAALMAVLVTPGADPSRIYYGTDTRLQTLLAGALLAVAISGRKLPSAAVPVAGIASLVGAVVLVGAFLRVPDSASWMYRGGFLLIAVASCAVIAGLALVPRSPLTRGLSTRPFVAVGVISYGLYLWHWPVFMALTPDRVGFSGWPLFALRCLATGVIATLSFRFVEQPIRQGALRRLPSRQRVAAILATGVATVLAIVLATAGAQASVLSGARGAVPLSAPVSGVPPVALLGDSQMATFAKDAPIGSARPLLGVTALGCVLLPEPQSLNGHQLDVLPECADWYATRASALRSLNPTALVVMPSVGELFDRVVDGRTITFGTDEYRTYLERGYASVRDILGPRVPLVMLSQPCHQVLNLSAGSTIPGTINDASRLAWLNSVTRAWVRSQPNATYVDIAPAVCEGSSPRVLEGASAYGDGLHTTPAGSRAVWNVLLPQIDAAINAGLEQDPISVFVLGDSQALALRSQLPADLSSRIAVSGSTELNCPLLPATMVAEGKVIPANPQCYAWTDRRAAEVAAIQPDIGVLSAGSWEQYDIQQGDRVLVAGSPEWNARLVEGYRQQLQLLHAGSKHVALLLDHCHQTPDTGIGPEPRVVNDQSRVELVNAAAREAASSVGFPVEVFDVNAFLCPRGFEATRDGVLLRVDGLHYTADGARIVWNWLAPQLAQVMRG